jgi:hypothetical protein
MGRNTTNIQKLPPKSASVTKAFNIQTTNGWQHFVRGRMAIEWGNAINEHLAKTNPLLVQCRTLGSTSASNKLTTTYIKIMDTTKPRSQRRNTGKIRIHPSAGNDTQNPSHPEYAPTSIT